MSDFAPGSTLKVDNFTAITNPDGTIGITVNFTVTVPSGAKYSGQSYLWSPSGPWKPFGDLQMDLQGLGQMAKAAAQAATGVLL